MPYIGNQSTNSYSSMVKQDLTGASGASVTLSHPVANANEVELYINNVRQEPTTSYTTSGTTLSFVNYTVAASDDIYVIFLGKALQTTVPPDGSVGTAKIADGAVSTAKLADNSVTSAKITGVSFGKVLQMKPFQTFAMDTGTVIIPNDNSIPQKTEGDEYMSLAFTPVASDSTLYVEVCIHLAHSTTTNDMISALFIDDASNAVAVSVQRNGTQNDCPHSLNFLYTMTSGTTNALTFKVRAGAGGAGTTTFNGRNAGALFGGVLGSTIKITEIGG